MKCQIHKDNNCGVKLDAITEDGSSMYYCPVNKSYFMIVPWKVKIKKLLQRMKIL